MNYFFESFEDYAANGGVITDALRDAYMDPCDIWAETYESSESHEDPEYREDKYEQLASRHGCWCILPARYIDSAANYLRSHVHSAVYWLRTLHITCVTLHITCAHHPLRSICTALRAVYYVCYAGIIHITLRSICDAWYAARECVYMHIIYVHTCTCQARAIDI